ncbi:MAG: cadherin-like beta sandwich domain-containing protein [Brotaphodocola sp.]
MIKSKIRKIGCRAALICAMAVILPFESLAATARIAFSDPSAQVGGEVNVTMKFTSTDGAALGNTDVMLAYDSEMLEFINETENASGGAGAIRVWTGPEGKTEMVTQLRFRALKPGTSQLTITDWEGYDNDGNSLTDVKQGSSKINIKALETSSDDAKLMSLQVSPGTLEPGFSPDVENYTVTVGLDVEKLTVSANPNNAKANVAVEGASELQETTNTVVCKVTAEDGSTVKNYTITVNKEEGGAGEADPVSGSETETQEQELEVLAELDVAAKKIRIAALPEGVEVPSYLKESSIAIGDVKVQGWTSAAEEKPSYCIFYGMNENGDADFYRYDLKDKTVQRLFQNEAGGVISQQQYDAVVEEHDSIVDDYNRMMFIAIGLGVVCIILIIVLIAVLRTRRSSEQEDFIEPKEKREPKMLRSAQGKKLSKEERYMMGVEDEYEEEDPEDYMPEPVAEQEPKSMTSKTRISKKAAEPEIEPQAFVAAEQAAAEEDLDFEILDEEEDDFEFFDLDD